jgi:hypothetical protein
VLAAFQRWVLRERTTVPKRKRFVVTDGGAR